MRDFLPLAMLDKQLSYFSLDVPLLRTGEKMFVRAISTTCPAEAVPNRLAKSNVGRSSSGTEHAIF